MKAFCTDTVTQLAVTAEDSHTVFIFTQDRNGRRNETQTLSCKSDNALVSPKRLPAQAAKDVLQCELLQHKGS